MKELTINDGVTELGVTTIDGEKAVVSSRDVADVFGKRHDNVLAKVDQIIERAEDGNFTALNFKGSKYKGESGRKNREYLLAKDGVVLLAMGYNGKKFIDLKVEYIKHFNRMEELIKSRHFTRIEYKPMMNALKEQRELQGKKTNHFHYSNEANMINRIVLNDTAKKYCEKNNIPRGELRDNLPEWQLKAIKQLQRSNTDLIQMGLDYQGRKELLSKKYNYLFHRLELAG